MNALQTIDRPSSVCSAPAPSRPTARLVAKFLPGRFDRQLAAGAPATPGSALDIHANRLRSAAEKSELADVLRRIADAPPTAAQPHRAPVARARVEAAHDLIDELRTRLQEPGPVNVQGIARLRMLLGDAAGPFYQCGKGELRDALRAVLAAL